MACKCAGKFADLISTIDWANTRTMTTEILDIALGQKASSRTIKSEKDKIDHDIIHVLPMIERFCDIDMAETKQHMRKLGDDLSHINNKEKRKLIYQNIDNVKESITRSIAKCIKR